MSDWADEIAGELIFVDHEDAGEHIATALRRAKADGMRQAAEMYDNTTAYDIHDGLFPLFVREQADKIEKGKA